MASQGPFLVAAGVNIAGPNVDWLTPGNVTADDASLATATTSGGGAVSDRLAATNPGFSIPSGATIDGIVVEVNDAADVGSLAELRLTKDGSAGVGTAVGWSQFTGWLAHGGATYLWGTTWTPAEINATTFGVLHLAGDDIVGVFASFDAVRFTVYYTDGGPPPDPQTARTGGVQVVGP